MDIEREFDMEIETELVWGSSLGKRLFSSARLFQFITFSLFTADHERDWPPCKVVFFGLATNRLNVRNNNNNNNNNAMKRFCLCSL